MRRRENYAYILDIIPPELATYRVPIRVRRSFPPNATYAHVVGEEWFTLLEVIIRQGAVVEIGERVYIGPGPRDKVEKIVRRVRYNELAPPARERLHELVRRFVIEQEQRFVKFFNEAGPITIKLHSLELLPGIGKKTLQQILAERRKRPFTSFEDIRTRIGIDPVDLVVKRVLRELEGGEQYYLFTAPPPSPEE